jgi:hypothetical protein
LLAAPEHLAAFPRALERVDADVFQLTVIEPRERASFDGPPVPQRDESDEAAERRWLTRSQSCRSIHIILRPAIHGGKMDLGDAAVARRRFAGGRNVAG